MHGNMVFSTHYILGTPQQSGGFLVCSVDTPNLFARRYDFFNFQYQVSPPGVITFVAPPF